MKNTLSLFLLIAFNLFSISTIFAQKAKDTKMKVSSSKSDAEITVNGKAAGNGGAEIKMLANSCTKISAKKEGFYAKSVEFCNNGITTIPKAYYIELEADAAFEASVKTDVANVDVSIRPKKSLVDVWKPVNSLVLQYIDAIEI